MHRLLVFATLCLFLCGAKNVDLESEMPADAHHLKIGDAAPDFSLKGIDGKIYTLADFKDAKLLLVAYLSNHCPYSHASETRLLPLIAQYRDSGLACVAINPNSPEAIGIGELGYSKYNDTYDEMKLYAKERGFTFPYLYDGETQTTAKAYGCLCTPHVFLFDQNRRLVYMGRVDDSRFADPATVTSFDLKNAVVAMLDGKPVLVPVTKPFGCSTKWKTNESQVLKIDQQWDATPVTLSTIDAAGANALAKNDSGNLRLINVWATWCVPCVAEFPNLVSISRRLANRDFEMITISVDDPSDQGKVKTFLQQEHAATPNRVARLLRAEGRDTNNYVFTGKDADALMQTLDPSAPGPVPFTVLIAPGGKILYSHAGEVDAADLLGKLVDTLGPYYTPASH